MIETPLIPLISLIISSIWFGLAFFDVVPFSAAALIGCLAFTLATAFNYWIYASHTCVGSNGQPKLSPSVKQKTPGDDDKTTPWIKSTPQSKKPNWLKKLWQKMKDWMKSFSPTDSHPDTEGIIIVQQDPKIKYLVSNSELGIIPDSLEKDETPSDAAQRSVTEKTALKPEDLKIVPNFSKEAVIETTDPEGKPEIKKIIFQLAEINPDTKVSKDSKWLTPEEALEQFPEMKPVITACNQKLTDPESESSTPKSDMMSKSAGMRETPLEQWYKDAEDKNLIWRVVERRYKRVMVKLDDHSFSKDKDGFRNKAQHNPCCKPIFVTAAISVATTLIVAAAVATLLHFFPDMFTKLWTGIVEFFGYMFDQLKAAAQFIWTKITGLF